MKTRVQLVSFLLLLYLVSTVAMAQQPKLEWAQRWNGVANVTESATAVALEAEGNSYVTDRSSGETSPQRISYH